MSDYLQYHNWLLKRSFKGLIYRKYYLYPKIKKNIKGTIIDIGCGIGDFLSYYPNSFGCDVNPLNIDYCKNKNLNVELIEDNYLPYKNNSFDNAILDNVIEHLFEFKTLLAETSRIVKPQGKIIIGIPAIFKFFHDIDHKYYLSTDIMLCNLQLNFLKCINYFQTPNLPIIYKNFTHSCRWFVYSNEK